MDLPYYSFCVPILRTETDLWSVLSVPVGVCLPVCQVVCLSDCTSHCLSVCFVLRAHLRLVLLRQYLHSHTTANEQPPSFFHIIYTMRIYLVHGFTLIPSSTITSWKLLTPSLPQLKHFPEGKDALRNIFPGLYQAYFRYCALWCEAFLVRKAKRFQISHITARHMELVHARQRRG